MSSTSARAVYRQYSSSSNLSSSENLPPRTLARLAREVRDLHKNPPEGVRLVIDDETGLPSNLGELMVSCFRRRPFSVTSLAALIQFNVFQRLEYTTRYIGSNSEAEDVLSP